MHVGVPTTAGCACRHPLLANCTLCCGPCGCMSQFDTGLFGDVTSSSGGDEVSSCGGHHESLRDRDQTSLCEGCREALCNPRKRSLCETQSLKIFSSMPVVHPEAYPDCTAWIDALRVHELGSGLWCPHAHRKWVSSPLNCRFSCSRLELHCVQLGRHSVQPLSFLSSVSLRRTVE